MTGMNAFLKPKQMSLFDLLHVPEGIDKETLVDNIMLQGGEFECLYADPLFMRDAIGAWSNKWQRTFIKWITALNIEYNPLENYDRMEDYSDTLNKGISTTGGHDMTNTRTLDNQDKRTLDTTTTSEIQVSAFDSSNYQPSEKTTVTNDGTDTVDYSGTITDVLDEDTSTTEKENSKSVHDGRIHGNIGTVTSQKMLGDELEIAKFNIYEQITDLFITEFLIMVYD